MYQFIDVNEVSEGASLPSEALKFNGEYIENLIEGYRTLSVSGREALTPEIGVHDNGIRDGASLLNRRYPPRIITVRYQLITKTPEAFREAYNNLAMILDVEEAQLIFNDEQDKFFTGTLYEIGEVDAGKNAVTGEFQLYCADPFKYSVEEYEVLASDIVTTDEEGNEYKNKAFVFDYGGSYKAFPTIETHFFEESEFDENGNAAGLTGSGDCGYVAFVNDKGSVVQLGDTEEVGGISHDPSQTLANQRFETSNAWSNAAKELWIANPTVEYYDAGFGLETHEHKGELNMSKPISSEDVYYLTPKSYGSGTGWHGPAIVRTLPPDETGESTANDFRLTYEIRMAINEANPNQAGFFGVYLLYNNGTSREVVLGEAYVKKASNTRSMYKYHYIGDEEKTYTSGSSIQTINASFDRRQSYTIQKSGNKIIFRRGDVEGYAETTFEKDVLKDIKVNEIMFVFGQDGTNEALTRSGVYSVKFTKDNCADWEDIPNKFSANDVAVADCRSAKILLNGIAEPKYGAIGNDWEDFHLHRGRNTINISYSDWVEDDYAPTFKLKYREVFI